MHDSVFQKQSFVSAPDSKAILYLRKIFPHSTASIGNFSNKECFLGQVEQPKKNSFGKQNLRIAYKKT